MFDDVWVDRGALRALLALVLVLVLALVLRLRWICGGFSSAPLPFLFDRVLLCAGVRLAGLSLSLPALLLELRPMRTLPGDKFLRKLLQSLARLSLFRAACRGTVDHIPRVLHEQPVLLLLVVGQTRQPKYVVRLQQCLVLLLRLARTGGRGLRIVAHLYVGRSVCAV